MKKNYISILFLFLPIFSQAQSKRFSFGVTPNLTVQPKVIHESPADIYGKRRINIQAQLLYNYIPQNALGYIMGINAGIFNWTSSLKAPQNAFGTFEGTGEIDFTIYSEDFYYFELMGGITKSGTLGKVKYRFETGPFLRYYPNQTEIDGIGAAFNRTAPYNPSDPNAGPPDLLIEIPPASQSIYPSIFTNFILPILSSNKSNLEIGVSKNWDLKPLKGQMTIRYKNTPYLGSFNPRSSYLGLNIRYGFMIGSTTRKAHRLKEHVDQ